MTAAGLRVLTLAFPDPDIQPIFSDDFQPVNASLSYSFAQADTIRTLSTTGSTAGHDIDGLLFTPSLPKGACPDASKYIPQNATKPTNLPSDTAIFWVALAPWINANCTLDFLAAVKGTPAQAFLFYLVDNSTSIPPVANDPVWGLGDGGRWKSSNNYPVYAIPSISGQTIMSNLANYSGNVTDVPNGHILANEWPSMDYIRLAVELNIEGGSKLPSLWVFLLVVLGILIIIIASTSCSMHWVQRRRRDRLRRRVANGDVDLEALGIKRLTVPQEVIDKMPLFTYSDEAEPAEKVATSSTTAPSETVASSSRTQLHATHFSQATCPICLDDYVAGETKVRELPCRHIFHPECVDSFLRQNSSLCPMCKKTVLPMGYCPAMVTNAMVRRERMVRRIRERVPAPEGGSDPGANMFNTATSIPRVRDAVRTAVAGGRRVFSAPIRAPSARPPPSPGVEMRSATNPIAVVEMPRPATATISTVATTEEQPCSPSPNVVPPVDRQSRREWARERAVAMLGNRRTVQDSEIEAEAARRPLWRRGVGRVWPGFA